MMTSMEVADLVIVGGGAYGLIAAYTWLRLTDKNPDCSEVIIFESDTSLGGTWSRNRIYPSLITQSPVGMSEYSCFPMDPPPPKDKTFYGYFPGEYVCDYLEAFAQSVKLGGKTLKDRIRFGAAVTFVRKQHNIGEMPNPNAMWEVTIVGGHKTLCKKLIMATGATSVPRLPRLLRAPQPIPVIHSRDLGRNAEFLGSDKVQNVVIIGGSKSAFDAVYMLIKAGKSVTWLIRKTGQGPGILAAPVGYGLYQNSHEILSLRLLSKMNPSIFDSDDGLSRFFHKWKLGQWLANALWWTVDFMWKGEAKYDRSANMANLQPDLKIFWASDNIGMRNTVDLWDTVAKARILRDEVAGCNNQGVVLESGETVKCEAIVACTGWHVSYPMFTGSDSLRLGLPLSLEDVPPTDVQAWEDMISKADKQVVQRFPELADEKSTETSKPTKWPNHLYRFIAPVNDRDRSVAFLGQIVTTHSFLIGETQSLWAVAYLLGDLSLPSVDKMQKDVALSIAWHRRRYLDDGHVIAYDQIPVSYGWWICITVGLLISW
jgi:dimethylaniline monooxygenase (N-oxide forming)